MSAFSQAWILIKAPLRGTSGKHFDRAIESGRFEPREGSGYFSTDRGVWATKGDGWQDADAAFHYAIRGDSGHTEQFNRAPVVHYIPRTENYSTNTGAGEGSIRFPGGVDANTTEEIWRGQTFSDWLNENKPPYQYDPFQSYRKGQRKLFMDAWRKWAEARQ